MGRRSLLVCVVLLMLIGVVALVVNGDSPDAEGGSETTVVQRDGSESSAAQVVREPRAPRKPRGIASSAEGSAADVQPKEHERHTLEVVVLDASSEPAVGAEVEAFGLQGEVAVDSVTGRGVRGTTDERGRTLLVSADYGYLTIVARNDGNVAIGSAQIAGVGESITLSLEPAVAPRGFVRSSDGRPIAGAQVWLTFTRDGFPATTEEGGAFVSHPIPAAWTEQALRYVVRGPGVDEVHGKLAAGEYDPVALEFTVDRVVVVVGRLVGASGRALPGVTLRTRTGRSTTTNKDGEFEIERVPAAAGSLALYAGVNPAGTIALEPDRVGPVDLGTVAVDELDVVTGLIRAATRVRGRSTTIAVEGETGWAGPSVVVDAGGSFVATVVGAGPFTVFARHMAPGEPPQGARRNEVLPGSCVDLLLAPASKLRIAFRSNAPWPTGHVTARVTVERPDAAPRLYRSTWRLHSSEPLEVSEFFDGDCHITVKVTGFQPVTVRDVGLLPSQTTDIAVDLVLETK